MFERDRDVKEVDYNNEDQENDDVEDDDVNFIGQLFEPIHDPESAQEL